MDEIFSGGILTVKSRESVTLDGVKNVEGFDESYVSLSTVGGRVIIEGADLKIESLTKENGAIYITGKINGVYFNDEKAAKGVFARLFK